MAVSPSDEELVALLQTGDLDALGVLYERYRPLVYRAAFKVTRDHQAAEDVSQECFLRVFRYAGSIDTSRPFRPWLYWVAVNRACDWYSRTSQRQLVDLDQVTRWLEITQDPLPEQQVELKEMTDRLLASLEEMEVRQRAVIVLYYLCSLSLKEVASLLDCPVGTVKSRLYYAREALRQQFESGSHVRVESAGAVL